MEKEYCGCGAIETEIKGSFEEVDGQEFEVSDIDGLLSVLKKYGVIHINYDTEFPDKDLDLWIGLRGVN